MGNCCSAVRQQKDEQTSELLVKPATTGELIHVNMAAATPQQPSLESNKLKTHTTPNTRSPDTPAQVRTSAKASQSLPPVENAKLREVETNLKKGMPVLVLLASGLALQCNVMVDQEKRIVSLYQEANSRTMTFDEIEAILFTKHDLKRIKIRADLTSDPNCCALCLKKQTCLTLRFNETPETHAFIVIMSKCIKS